MLEMQEACFGSLFKIVNIIVFYRHHKVHEKLLIFHSTYVKNKVHKSDFKHSLR